MSILVTGVAGFIGFHLAAKLLDQGEKVVGIDNLNTYYDVRLKQARLTKLNCYSDFRFFKIDVADRDSVFELIERERDLRDIAHLAAQAGVRHSLDDPYSYIDSNVMGTLVILEVARRIEAFRAVVYASSSSVYGGNKKQPFSIDDAVDHPVSLYGASKRSCELIAESYTKLYGLSATGLRFFTVYGPWGRPDMAAYIFTRAILTGAPIQVFNNGKMQRDFTYIDDIVQGIVAALDRPPGAGQHRIYNLGNHRPEQLLNFIEVLERALGRTSVKEFLPMQVGDVEASFADIERTCRDLGFEPKTTIEEGIPAFVNWYREYHGIAI